MTTEELHELERLLGLALSDKTVAGPFTYNQRWRRGTQLVHGLDAVVDAIAEREAKP